MSVDAEGYLYPAGRLSDTINRGGEKFAPMEVEEVVRRHPAVRDVAVVGVPDAEMGQPGRCRGGCRRRSHHRGAPRLLPRAASRRSRLPERLLVVDELPYNDFGKVDRKALRALIGASE